MRIAPTPLAGVHLVEPEPVPDTRGFFARLVCADSFAAHGMVAEFPQCSVSWNRVAATLRGLHWQAAPHAEAKLVRCTRGAVFDVAVDLRPNSPSYRRWVARELSAENRLALYIPAGCAHGFLTLVDDTELFYQISAPHVPDAARGLRWNDPEIGIDWPMKPAVMSERDAALPDWADAMGQG